MQKATSHATSATFVDRQNDFKSGLLGGSSNGSGSDQPIETAKNGGVVKASSTLDLTKDYWSNDRPFFVEINDAKGGVIGALRELDTQLVQAGRAHLLSKKKPWSLLGRTVPPGAAGIYDHGGLPKVIISPGRYPGFPWANWVARTWQGITPLNSTVISHAGLTIVQVAQNQAAVIADPGNNIFVLKHRGFASLSIEGNYRVLGIVDQVNLKKEVFDPLAGGDQRRLLGHYEEVIMHARVDGRESKFVVATFLDIPANNCVICQKGDELIQLPAGQHCITNPSITVRGWFSRGEAQLELPSRDMYTRDQVPVELRVYLRWQLVEPLKLCTHGYETPYQALKDKTLSVLTQIVAHLEYSSMIKQRSFNPGDDAADGPDVTSQAFLDALRTRAMDELRDEAFEYGIVLKDLAVLDRHFKGEIARTMDNLTTRALQAQVEAANVLRENDNKVKAQEGMLQVAQVQAQVRKTEADAQAYTILAQARAEAEATKIRADAQAEAARIAAKADSEVKDPHAQSVQLARVDVQRIQAYGDKTVFVSPSSGGSALPGGAGSDAMANNYAAGLGFMRGVGQRDK